MELIINRPAANAADYPTPEVVTDVRASAANDCAHGHGQPRVVDVNVLVGRVVAHVMAKVSGGPNVDLQLVLAPGRHVVQGDPVALSFALSGILAAQLRAADEGDGDIAVTTAASGEGVRVMISNNGIPPLEFVRAIANDGGTKVGDPTLAHCRRLIEAEGGRLCLVEQAGSIALCVVFPPVLPTNVLPLTSTKAKTPRAELEPLVA